MQRALQDLLRKRMDRAIATVLSCKEQGVDTYLNGSKDASEASRKLRKEVLDQFNSFYEVCLDVMGSLDNGEVVLNEHFLKKIDEIHQTLTHDKGIRLSDWEPEATGTG